MQFYEKIATIKGIYKNNSICRYVEISTIYKDCLDVAQAIRPTCSRAILDFQQVRIAPAFFYAFSFRLFFNFYVLSTVYHAHSLTLACKGQDKRSAPLQACLTVRLWFTSTMHLEN